MDVEVIEFSRPQENEKNIYVTNIPRKYEETQLYVSDVDPVCFSISDIEPLSLFCSMMGVKGRLEESEIFVQKVQM